MFISFLFFECLIIGKTHEISDSVELAHILNEFAIKIHRLDFDLKRLSNEPSGVLVLRHHQTQSLNKNQPKKYE